MGKVASIKLIVCFTLILLIPLMPNMGIVSSASPVHYGASLSRYYSFSGQNYGAFPSNESWIRFSTAGEGTDYNFSMEDGQYGNSIMVKTDDNLSAAYMKMSFNTSMYAMVQIGFSWNNSVGAGDTLANFSVYFGNTETGCVSISSGYNSTTVTAMGNRYRLSYEPETGMYYDLKLYFSAAYGNIFYMKLSKNSTSQLVLPISVPTDIPFANNLSIMAGGTKSEMNIYNITDVTAPNGIFKTVSNGTEMGSSSSGIPHNLRPYGPGDQAVLVPGINSAYYVAWNNTVVRYNYENMSFSNTALDGVNASMKPLGISARENTLYFLMSYGPVSTIFSLNASTGAQGNITTGGFQDAEGMLRLGNNRLAAYNSSGGIIIINTSSGEVRGSISAWNAATSYHLAGIYQENGSVIIDGVNLSTRTGIIEEISPGTLQKTVLSSVRFSRFDGTLGISSSTVSGGGVTTVMNNTLTGHNYFTLVDGIYEELENGSTSVVSPGQDPVTFNGSAYVLTGTSSGLALQIPKIKSPQLWFSNNYTAGSEINSSEILIFFSNQSEVYSGNNITIRLGSRYLLRGEANVTVNILSKVAYRVEITIGNFHQNSSGDYLIIDSRQIPDGNYTMYVNASNVDGYSASDTALCTVDNNNPIVLSNPSNGSSVDGGQDISINVSNVTGLKEYNVSAPEIRESIISTGGATNITAKSGLSQFTVYVNITDIYGLKFSRYLVFTVLNTSLSNFSINLYNGEFFRQDNPTFSWTPLENVTSYELRILGNNYSESAIVNGSEYRIVLENGNFTLYLYPVLGDGKDLATFEYNFTIIAFSPGVAVTGSNNSMYSFFGNSRNSSLYISIKANISADIRANFTSPSGVVFDETNAWNSLQIKVAHDSRGFGENGMYVLSYSAVSQSGTSTHGNFMVVVNNTVPTFGNSIGKTIFTNVSSIHINPGVPGNTRLSYSFTKGTYREDPETLENETVNLSDSQGLYNISVLDMSRSGNFAYDNFTVLYSMLKPVVMVTAPERQVRYANYSTILYSVRDPAPIEFIRISIGNHTYSLAGPEQNGSLMVFFPANGLYNISITAEDRCLNSNSSSGITLNVTYYVTVNEANIASSIFGTSGRFKLEMTGTELQNVNLSWYLNGKYVGSGQAISVNMPLGSSNVTCIMEYDGRSFAATTHTYVIGFDPFYAALLSIIAVSGGRYAISRRTDGLARELVMRSSGKSVSEIRETGRKSKVPGSSIRRAVRRLSGTGEITTERDLSNEVYVFVNGEAE